MILSSADLWACKEDPWYFKSNFVNTFDERDEVRPDVKPYPAHWTIFADLIREFEIELRKPGYGFVGVPKSRQLMVSWTVCAYMICKCMFRARTSCVIQSKVAKDSLYQIKRAKAIYDYLDPSFHEIAPLTKMLALQPVDSILFKNGSGIVGEAGGGDKIRSIVPTILLSDEACYQDEFDEVMTAAGANVSLHIVVSSPRPGTFQKIIEDTYGY